MSIEGGRIITILGQSGSGKTTQIGELVKIPEFRVLPSQTTRTPRPSDLRNEYSYLGLLEYEEMSAIPGRFLWDVVTGDGDRYAKDICDVFEAITDPDHAYVNALTPHSAHILAKKYGSEIVRTVLLPSPSDDVLIDRMIKRGDVHEKAVERLSNEARDNWIAQSLTIEGIYIVESLDINERNKEILDFVLG